MRAPRGPRFWAPLAIGLFAAQGCAHQEPATRSPGPSTAGGEATAVPVVARGNEPSAQMAVADRPPPPPVDPSTVSSEPSTLIQKPAPPAPPQQQPPTYVTTPPPAPRPEAYPTETSPDWVWAPGYWYWHGGQYVWISGTWIPARRGHVYVNARWVHSGRSWMFVPGGWAVSTYDPILYPVYPYDPFYYRGYYGYFYDYPYYRRGYGHHRHRQHHRDRLLVRPDGPRHIDRTRRSSSPRLRVRAR